MLNPEDISIERAAFKVRAEAISTSLLERLGASQSCAELGMLGPARDEADEVFRLAAVYHTLLTKWCKFEGEVKCNIPPA